MEGLANGFWLYLSLSLSLNRKKAIKGQVIADFITEHRDP
jgi:hypothetical protein